MWNAAIRSTGSYVPDHIIHNESLSQYPTNAKKMISQKTGVFSRRHAAQEQCTSDLAVAAARRCLAKADFPVENLDAIILSTSSPDRIQPATATRLQHLLGAVNAYAFDINSVCSGSTYGIAVSQAMIRAGLCSNLLFVAAENYSKLLNPNDFSTFPYFGDGAGAIFFIADETHNSVLSSVLGTDGAGADTICVPGGGTMLPFHRNSDAKLSFFRMKGRDVFKFATTKGSEAISHLLADTGTPVDNVKCFICHQANVHIILSIAEQLQISEEKFYMNLFRYGNTASASVLIALDEALESGWVAPGDLVVTAAFGGGLSWGANLLHL